MKKTLQLQRNGIEVQAKILTVFAKHLIGLNLAISHATPFHILHKKFGVEVFAFLLQKI